jgi:hypothetical protein
MKIEIENNKVTNQCYQYKMIIHLIMDIIKVLVITNYNNNKFCNIKKNKKI